MNPKIPKRIIQTGKSLDLPLYSQASAINLKLLNPDFEYLFFDDHQVEDFIDKQLPAYQDVFHSFNYPIQKFDFFRYLAIYQYGGFYFDLDVFLVSNLSALLNFSCVFTFEELTLYKYLRKQYGIDWEIGNYAFGAAPGHPFIQAVIENCVRAQKDKAWAQEMIKPIPKIFREDFNVLCTTGPGLVTRTLAENPEAAMQVKILFPEDVFNTKNWHGFGSFGVHAQQATWRKEKNIFIRRLSRFWESRTRKKLLQESLNLGKIRTH